MMNSIQPMMLGSSGVITLTHGMLTVTMFVRVSLKESSEQRIYPTYLVMLTK